MNLISSAAILAAAGLVLSGCAPAADDGGSADAALEIC